MENIPSLTGKGLDIVKMINKLPFQLHLPGHNYTGPGTHLYRNLALNIKPINKIDEASFYHDLDYSQGIDKTFGESSETFEERSNDSQSEFKKIADNKLIDKTKEIYKDSNNSLRERGEAFLVNNIMKFKTFLGAGIESNSLRESSEVSNDLLSIKLKFIKFLENSNKITELTNNHSKSDKNKISKENLNFLKSIADIYKFYVIK